MAGRTLYHTLHMAVKTFVRGVLGYLFHQHWLQIVVAWKVPLVTSTNQVGCLE